MGEISGSESVTINAPFDEVLAAVHDLDSSTQWFPGLVTCEVLESDDEGRPLRAHQVNDLKIAKDEFDLLYTHDDTTMSWSLAAPSTAQKSNTGSWELVDNGDTTTVTFSLAIEPSLPIPSFMLKKSLGDTLKGATKGLKKHCES